MSNAADQRSTSLWMDIDVAPEAVPLSGDRQCDVAIIGSGIAGISTACELAAKGRQVVVVKAPAIRPLAEVEIPE